VLHVIACLPDVFLLEDIQKTILASHFNLSLSDISAAMKPFGAKVDNNHNWLSRVLASFARGLRWAIFSMLNTQSCRLFLSYSLLADAAWPLWAGSLKCHLQYQFFDRFAPDYCTVFGHLEDTASRRRAVRCPVLFQVPIWWMIEEVMWSSTILIERLLPSQ
jgi:hypothetical protein